MSIPTPKTQQQNNNNVKRMITPVIPFDCLPKQELKKDDFLTFKLHTNPAQDTSPTYDLTVPFFNCGTAEELFDLVKNINRGCQGQNVTDGPNKYAVMRCVLQGDALTAFNRGAVQRGNEMVANFKLAVQDLVSHVLPRRALAIQRRYMRWFLQKAPGITICNFMTHLVEINQLLNEFPPFGKNQALPEDELLDIAEFAIPAEWQRTMVLQGFDPMEHSINEFIEFCEHLEFAEGIDPH